jgi:Protein of unknown function (DUF3667)
MAMIGNDAWTCPTCNHAVSTRHCPACGERALEERDLTLRGFFEQVFVAFTNVDSQLIRSLFYLVARPGALTMAYLQGRRLPYIRPLQLFLIANVLFFAMESLTNSTIFSTPLDAHLHTQPWSGFAESLVTRRLMSLHTTMELYEPVFDRAVAVNARTLVISMALAFAPVLSIVFYRKHRPFMANVVFSLHLYAFVLLLFSCTLTAMGVSTLLGGPGLQSQSLDDALSVGLLMACGAYLYAAIGTAYSETGILRVLKGLVLTMAVAAIVLGYRFGLLLITLYTA